MAPPTDVKRVRPKRKRQEICYNESSPTPSDDESQIKAAPPKKKLKPLPKKKKKTFPFLSLPGEIRNKIYSLALTHHTSIHLTSRNQPLGRYTHQPTTEELRLLRQRKGRDYALIRRSTPPTITRASLIPAILSLNHQVYAEARPYLYAGNTFALEDTTALHDFLGNIGPKNRATIKTLSLKHWGWRGAYKALNFAAFALLASATGLERLFLDAWVVYGDARIVYGDPVKSARRFYGDAYLWLWAVGGVNGDMGKVRDVLRLGGIDLLKLEGINLTRGGKRPMEEMIDEFEGELERLLKD